ncbi:NAD(P)-binding domain-containing protein [Rhizobium sp. 32-5/1]|uniref:FAD-dependent oxidoreductase n=1 Tax=Rhizobium sp. 32-5/1 TaxID=3019602 RepID=UPI00240DD5E1|nr:FAD-dependent oxidoreductase [Rhizobium sp. 32-5/1]WEZ83400.1 NAD(P)-binding domain-containing protein [Rhizobium sp. 32-5/1]
MKTHPELPVAVIGAGPVGLAAAAHLVGRGIRPLILERGRSAGASLLSWGHVRVFTPWRYVTDEAAVDLLSLTDWAKPADDAIPTGREIVEDYLEPLARLPAIASNLVYGATVTSISRHGLDKVTSRGRDDAAFEIRYTDPTGAEMGVTARAVLDASGTWGRPAPMGIDGLPVIGERAASDRIAYGIPDIDGRDAADYAGRSVLVVGGGHSAINAVLALMALKKKAPATLITWALRRNRIDRLLGGGLNDQLPSRGDLGLAAKDALESEHVRLLAPFAARSIRIAPEGVEIEAMIDNKQHSLLVDRVIVATGFRPDLEMLNELRLDMDSAVECPRLLAQMIDPNLHSCGTVPPHGIAELTQPEPGFYIVGSKSYGRAPTFLMLTGYEQVRSVVAELAGDHQAARDVRLVLPETGVCSTSVASISGVSAGGCCGGPAPADTDACCLADQQAKVDGKSGCGCATPAETRRMEPAE